MLDHPDVVVGKRGEAPEQWHRAEPSWDQSDQVRLTAVAKHRQLKNAPVREALIDLQFESPLSLEAVDHFVASIHDTYGKKQDLWEAMFSLSGDGQTARSNATSTAVGRRLQSTDGQFVLQARISGFTLSRLSPYGKWDDLRSESIRLWKTLIDQVGRFVVSRVAVRYINEIKLLLPIEEFDKYLTCPPKVPAAVPQAVSGFLTRVVIPDPKLNCVSIVTQALEAPASEGPAGASITVLLDIDIFRLGRCDSGDDSIWQILDVLRDQKNQMFFEHLTEKTVEMYE